MIWYTVRLNSYCTRTFVSREAAQEYADKYLEDTGVSLTIIERRSDGDTKKPEQYS